MKSIHYAMALLLGALSLTVQAADNMKAFPPADEGMTRFVLQLPAQEDEALFKIELIVGKTVNIETSNRYFFGGQIESSTIQGWGFTKYTVDRLGPMAGTMMAINPNAPKADRFITLGGEPYLIRYNSRLPVVVYVPDGTEVRYRIWRADPAMSAMPEG